MPFTVITTGEGCGKGPIITEWSEKLNMIVNVMIDTPKQECPIKIQIP